MDFLSGIERFFEALREALFSAHENEYLYDQVKDTRQLDEAVKRARENPGQPQEVILKDGSITKIYVG